MCEIVSSIIFTYEFTDGHSSRALLLVPFWLREEAFFCTMVRSNRGFPCWIRNGGHSQSSAK